MPISLKKGQKVDLTKGNKGLNKIIVGLGWDTNNYEGNNDFDLDASAFVLGSDNKVLTQEDFIFYGNLEHKAGCVVHTGDNLTGEGEGDDEQIIVEISKIPSNVAKIAFTVTIHEAQKRNQNFGQVANAFIRLVNEANNEELIRYDLGENFSIETALVVAEIYRHETEWKVNAIGSGFSGGLAALCKNFGIDAV